MKVHVLLHTSSLLNFFLLKSCLYYYRLGFLVDFLSHAAIVGFMAGASITISLQQLKGLLGIVNFSKKTDAVSVLHSVFSTAHHGVIATITCIKAQNFTPKKIKSSLKSFLCNIACFYSGTGRLWS